MEKKNEEEVIKARTLGKGALREALHLDVDASIEEDAEGEVAGAPQPAAARVGTMRNLNLGAKIAPAPQGQGTMTAVPSVGGGQRGTVAVVTQ